MAADPSGISAAPVPQSAQAPTSARKDEIRAHADRYADERDAWIAKAGFFHEAHMGYLRFLIPEGRRVLELGCGTGHLLAGLKPSVGVGVDFSAKTVDAARRHFGTDAGAHLSFLEGDIEDPATIDRVLEETGGEPFDVILLSDSLGFLDDIETTLRRLHRLCNRNTRIVVAYYSHLWEPPLKLAESFGLKMPQVWHNWLSMDDIANLFDLAGFDVVKREWRQIVPMRLFGLGALLNRYLGTLPAIRRLGLRNYMVARSLEHAGVAAPKTSVVIPCRNEKGNIERAIHEMPAFPHGLEILFVEGNSTDDTYAECERVRDAYPDLDIKVMRQPGKGKGDAVRCGFEAASGDVLMILDADLTVRPSDLPKFLLALMTGKGEYINGTRLVYPMEAKAMRFLNFLGNRFFALVFTWLLNQRFTDTLCGTKVLTRDHYDQIAANRAYFGEFDPFGDFDLIFGAAKQNLKIVEVPIRYAERTYGETNISRWSHGWLLLRMTAFAFRKLKAF